MKRHARQLQCLEIVEAHPHGISLRQVAAMTGLSTCYAQHVLHCLRDRGLIAPTRPGSHASVWLTAERAEAWAKQVPAVVRRVPVPVRVAVRLRIVSSVFEWAGIREAA